MPLSSDPDRRRKQLANLRRGLSDDRVTRARQLENLRPVPENLKPAPPAPIGNQRRVVHGGRSEILLQDVEAEVAELAAALGDTAPVRDPDGSLPSADLIAVEAAARALKRWRHVSRWCDAHGRLVERSGKVKPAAELEVKAERQLHEALNALGMTPMARSRLGLNIARAQHFDLAQAWAAQTADESTAGEVVDATVADGDA